MPWTHVPHTRCAEPVFVFFQPHGSIWTCDICGKRWLLDRTPDSAGGSRVCWRRVDVTGIEIVNAVKEAEAARMVSTEIVDVAWRERRAALTHLHRGFTELYAELGLTRSPLKGDR